MIIYEVNIEVNKKIYTEYKKWLHKHMDKMLTYKGFIKANLFENMEEVENSKLVTITYYVDSFDNLKNYLKNHSDLMRQEGRNKFGNNFKAYRRIFRSVSTVENQAVA